MIRALPILFILMLISVSCLAADLQFCAGQTSCAGKNPRIKHIQILQQNGVRARWSPDGKTIALLSRRKAQEECVKNFISSLTPGAIIDARVTHLDPFGAFVDIGCGIVSLIPIDLISVSRISHPHDRFTIGQDIRVIVKYVDQYTGRVCLSHKELLGTWEENATLFGAGETVAGIIRSVESYGIFIELSPNLAGLAEPKEGVRPGQQASVYIKNLIPEKMKVKLIIVDSFEADYTSTKLHYFVNDNHIDRWIYSPPSCPKAMETVFNGEYEEYEKAECRV